MAKMQSQAEMTWPAPAKGVSNKRADANHVYVAGLPDASGDFSGFTDDATSQTYLAAVDGLPRAFYLYPNVTSDPYFYWFGQILPDMSSDGGVTAASTFKSTWNAASRISRYTQWGGLDT